MDGTDPKDTPIPVSATILGEIRQEIAEAATVATKTWDLVQVMSSRQQQQGQDLAVLTSRFSDLKKEHDERMEDGSCPPDGGRPQRSPSNLYESVGKRIEQQGEEVTERIKLEAIVAAKAAVADEIAEHGRIEAARLRQEAEVAAAQLKADTEAKAAQLKLDHDAKIAEIEMRHKRSMSRIAIIGAIVTALIGTGVFSAVRTLFSTEAAQAETTKVLKRIEAKQAKMAQPDAAVEP